jgi:hypothetical protein
MVGRQRNRWGRFGFVLLDVVVVRMWGVVPTRAVVPPWAVVTTLAAVLGA